MDAAAEDEDEIIQVWISQGPKRVKVAAAGVQTVKKEDSPAAYIPAFALAQGNLPKDNALCGNSPVLAVKKEEGPAADIPPFARAHALRGDSPVGASAEEDDEDEPVRRPKKSKSEKVRGAAGAGYARDSSSGASTGLFPGPLAPPPPEVAAAAVVGLGNAAGPGLRYGRTGPRATAFLKTGYVVSSAWSHLELMAKDQRGLDVQFDRMLVGGGSPWEAAECAPPADLEYTERVYINDQFLPPPPDAHRSVARALGLTHLSRGVQATLAPLMGSQDEYEDSDAPSDDGRPAENPDHGPVIMIECETNCAGIVKSSGEAMRPRLSEEQAALARAGLEFLGTLTVTTPKEEMVDKPLVQVAADALLPHSKCRAPLKMLLPNSTDLSLDRRFCGMGGW